MLSRSKSLNLTGEHPWLVSVATHAALVALAFAVFFSGITRPRKEEVDIQVIDAPQKPLTAPALKPIEPKAPPKKSRVHEVFGVSRKAITSDDGPSVKPGNTITKAPDNEVLKKEDPDQLPVPTEEYLVTQMPVMVSDIHVPYPPGPKSRGVQGRVVMELLIDSTGKVREVKLIEAPDPELGRAATEAAPGFQFKPAKIKDQPVAVRIHYSYRFVLEHR